MLVLALAQTEVVTRLHRLLAVYLLATSFPVRSTAAILQKSPPTPANTYTSLEILVATACASSVTPTLSLSLAVSGWLSQSVGT